MSENLIDTKFFGKESNVPKSIQLLVASAFAGAMVGVSKKSIPTTQGGVKKVITVQVYRYANGHLKPMSVTLTNLAATTDSKLYGEAHSLGLDNVYKLISENATDEAVLSALDESLEKYTTKFDPNKLAEYKKEFISNRISNLIESCTEAGVAPAVTEKIKRIYDEFETKKKQAAVTENKEIPNQVVESESAS